jgi:hypothetical protein
MELDRVQTTTKRNCGQVRGLSARFETSHRCSATGVTTVAILVVVLAMAVSTLLTPEAAVGATAATGQRQLTQVHGQNPIKKS